MNQLWEPTDLPTCSIKSLAPNPAGTAAVFKRMGHKLEEALAELVDNSIDALASNIIIRLIIAEAKGDAHGLTGRVIRRIAIADDGYGMEEDRLEEAMQHGNSIGRDGNHIGKYGIGLKASSFSQCECMTVLSWKSGPTHGRRWNRESIKDRWDIELIDPAAADHFVRSEWQQLAERTSGTVVIWDRLDSPIELMGQSERNLQLSISTVRRHLGLYFHRFLQRANPIRMTIEVYNETLTSVAPVGVYAIEPLDPFSYRESGHSGFPLDFKFRVAGHGVTARAHIWPRKSKEIGYTLGGGKVAESQGFFFYRNDRLIQAGGWNGFRDHDTEPHLSLARVEVDLPGGLDSEFRLSVQKTDVEPPRQFIEAIRNVQSGTTTFQDYLRIAQEVYRGIGTGPKPDVEATVPALPGKGFAASVQRRVAKTYVSKDVPVIDFVWVDDLENDIVVDLDIEQRQVLLNSYYRYHINGGARASSTDAGAFKATLLMLLGKHFQRERISKKVREELGQCNTLLLEVLKA
jgi:hypothetical protein